MDSTALSALGSSNLPVRQKTYFARLIDGLGMSSERVTSMTGAMRKHLESTGTAARQLAETGATGVALAAVDVYKANGLDIKGKYPIDGGIALLGMGGSVFLAGHEVAPTLRSVGTAAVTVLAFRKAHAYFTRNHVEAGGTPTGTLSSPAQPPAAGAGQSPAASFGDDGSNAVLAKLAAEL
jgi:hypothetical protein